MQSKGTIISRNTLSDEKDSSRSLWFPKDIQVTNLKTNLDSNQKVPISTLKYGRDSIDLVNPIYVRIEKDGSDFLISCDAPPIHGSGRTIKSALKDLSGAFMCYADYFHTEEYKGSIEWVELEHLING